VHFRASTTGPKNGALSRGNQGVSTDPDLLALEVVTLALDDFSDIEIDFMKIDVEGAEEALWGLQTVIRQNPNIKPLLESDTFRCPHPERTIEEIEAVFCASPARLRSRLRCCGAKGELGVAADLRRGLDAVPLALRPQRLFDAVSCLIQCR